MDTGYAVGVFDLLHWGHKALILRALERCDKLVVAVHTDEFVRGYKRLPAQNAKTRAANIEAFVVELFGASANCSSHRVIVVVGDDHTQFCRQYGITVIFHGTDWELESYKRQIRYVEDKLTARIELLPYTYGVSTTAKLAKTLPDLGHIRTIFFDLDGTLLLNSKACLFAAEALAHVRRTGRSCVVLTNNNLYRPAAIRRQLSDAGLVFQEDEIRSSLHSVAAYCGSTWQEEGSRIAVWGTEDAFAFLTSNVPSLKWTLIQSLEACEVSSSSSPWAAEAVAPPQEEEKEAASRQGFAAVLVLFRPDFNALELTTLCSLCAQTPYLLGNIDKLYPDKNQRIPDTGSLACLLQSASGKAPLKTFGKPSVEMLGDYDAATSMVVGDSRATDGKLAENAGVRFLHLPEDISHLGVLCDLLL